MLSKKNKSRQDGDRLNQVDKLSAENRSDKASLPSAGGKMVPTSIYSQRRKYRSFARHQLLTS